MKKHPMPVVLIEKKKMLFAIFGCVLLMLFVAPAWGDVCSTAIPAVSGCGAMITISGTRGNLSATITLTEFGAYDGSDDYLVGIQNTSSVAVGAIILSAPSIEGTSNLFAFDHDGACNYFELQNCGPTGYEGPNNTFVGISADKTTGKVLFTTPLLPPSGETPGGTTWFSLEGAPVNTVAIGENQTLTGGTTSIYKFGPGNPTLSPNPLPPGSEDDFKITPQKTAADDPTGDSLTVTPVPVDPSQFSATNFPTLACIPYFDYSSNSDGTNKAARCVELELDCTGKDSCNFQYTAQLDYGIYGPGVPSGNLIGGPHFLVQHDVPCPATGFSDDIVISYTGANAGPATSPDPPPIKVGGKPGHSCGVSAFDPSAPVIPAGVTVSTFDGFELLSPTKPNPIFTGFPEFLIFDVRDSSGNPVTDLTLCANTSCPPPFVNLSSFAIANCPAGFPPAGPLPSFLNSGLLPGDEAGEYVFIWDTRTKVKVKGCQVGVAVQLGTGPNGTGPNLTPDTFQYKF
jgi:hypothetical protein